MSMDWKDIDYEQEQAGWSRAEKAIRNPQDSGIETFVWWGPGFLDKVKRGERVLMNTKMDSGKVLVSPPGRVLDIRRYRVKKKIRAMVYVEVPKRKRGRNLASFMRALGPIAKSIGNPRRTKRLSEPELIYMLSRVFA